MTASLRVCSFESRRATEMASLLARCGAEGTLAPSLREVPLEDNAAAIEFARAITDGTRPVDVLIFLTGVGTRTLFDAACTVVAKERFVESLKQRTVIVRGPKPVVVLREWGIPIHLRAPEPNTWHEIISALDESSFDLAGKHVVVQEYGQPTPELYAALRDRGATVWAVPVYQWQLPEEIGPLEDAVRRTTAGEFDILMFTSAQQVRNVLEIAESLNLTEAFRSACNRCLIASIGPTTTETLLGLGFNQPFEPSHPKMGHLVVESCQHYRDTHLES